MFLVPTGLGSSLATRETDDIGVGDDSASTSLGEARGETRRRRPRVSAGLEPLFVTRGALGWEGCRWFPRASRGPWPSAWVCPRRVGDSGCGLPWRPLSSAARSEDREPGALSPCTRGASTSGPFNDAPVSPRSLQGLGGSGRGSMERRHLDWVDEVLGKEVVVGEGFEEC